MARTLIFLLNQEPCLQPYPFLSSLRLAVFAADAAALADFTSIFALFVGTATRDDATLRFVPALDFELAFDLAFVAIVFAEAYCLFSTLFSCSCPNHSLDDGSRLVFRLLQSLFLGPRRFFWLL